MVPTSGLDALVKRVSHTVDDSDRRSWEGQMRQAGTYTVRPQLTKLLRAKVATDQVM